MLDLGVLHVDGRAKLLFLAHDGVHRHLSEVAGKNRVAAALVDWAVRVKRRGGRDLERSVFGPRSVGVEVVIDNLEMSARSRCIDRIGIRALEIIADRRVDRASGLRVRAAAMPTRGMQAS
jgi:hypothetical protein